MLAEEIDALCLFEDISKDFFRQISSPPKCPDDDEETDGLRWNWLRDLDGASTFTGVVVKLSLLEYFDDFMEEATTRGAGGGVPRDWLPDVDVASSLTCGAAKLSLLEYFEYF